jgi:hypothetical protein
MFEISIVYLIQDLQDECAGESQLRGLARVPVSLKTHAWMRPSQFSLGSPAEQGWILGSCFAKCHSESSDVLRQLQYL